MVFAHGFGCDQNMWRYLTPAFENDYKIVVFDYVGSGGSDLKAYDKGRYSSLDGYASDVLDIIHELDLRDVILVGHSVSSMIGVLAANQEPDRFQKLIMIGPSPRYINEDDPPYVGGFNRSDIEGLFEMMDRNFMGWANFLVMRRTHATLMKALGIDGKLVADQLGHSLDVNQNVYTQSPVETRLAGLNQLEKSLAVN